MSKKDAAIVAILTILAVAQTSFMPHFEAFRPKWLPGLNFIDAAVAIIALFERRRHKSSWLAAVLGGAISDLYSSWFFGFRIAVYLVLVALIKFVIKKYVRVPSYW